MATAPAPPLRTASPHWPASIPAPPPIGHAPALIPPLLLIGHAPGLAPPRCPVGHAPSGRTDRGAGSVRGRSGAAAAAAFVTFIIATAAMGSMQQRLQRFLHSPGPIGDLLGQLEARTGVQRLYLATGATGIAGPPRSSRSVPFSPLS